MSQPLLGVPFAAARTKRAHRGLCRSLRVRWRFERYGPRYDLPTAISPNNSYYLWGTRGYSGRSMLAVGATDYSLLLRWFGSVRQIAVYRNDYRWILEGPLPIYLCTHPRAPLAA